MTVVGGPAPRTPGATSDGGRWRADVVSAALTMAAVLTSFGGVYGLSRCVDVPHQDLVLAAVLALTLSRAFGRADHSRLLAAVEVPLVGVAATWAGWLLIDRPWVGQPLLVLALSLGVQARRWGGLVPQAGRLVALPFLALLVTPVPPVPRSPSGGSPAIPVPSASAVWWGAAVGLLAVACAAAAQWCRARLAPAAGPLPASGARRRGRRLDAGTRAALQLLLALGGALVLGHLLFGDRWRWAVVSAYLVLSSARGRGDVVHKAVMRVVGAAAGTVAATLVTAHGLPAGNRWLVVAVFVVMAAAVVVRDRNYAYWAAGVTAMIALLDGYYGEDAARALPERVAAIVVGATLGALSAWFVVPVRSRDVLRSYLARGLAALSDELAPDAAGAARTQGTLRLLRELEPMLRAHRRTVGRGQRPHAVDAVAALHRLAVLPGDERERRVLRRDVTRVRRAIVGRDDPAPDELPPDLAVVHAVLAATRTSRRRTGHGGGDAPAASATGLPSGSAT
ncbi:Fusaric acid resistance protein-like [Jatrophihabitans endophyticus]|uniref:Fusaric acid resistance protein-like n=1 Tax=Jatrophihabitans endophyticus TaxID=1206085 RepID=A0A1M5C7W0_9ACTN|nr:FUSC family protein [Jatrophihabitans endophyticus]SHF50482.1 Fusaric acid resistance protein-like [Jatrophihabitans endophyticus]